MSRCDPYQARENLADTVAVPEEDSVIVETEKVAKLVVYFCSDAGSIANGAAWTADGGQTAN